MENEGVVLRTALGLKDMGHRLRIQTVGPQAVHCLGWDTQKAPPPQNLRRLFRLGGGQSLCIHAARLAPQK